MNSRNHVQPTLSHPSRRTFVKGLAISGAAASLGVAPRMVWAHAQERQDAEVLSGTELNLRIGETEVNFTGRSRTALTINGSLPGPLLRWKEGDTITLNVANALDHDTSIHWHGILLPADMDGVPGLSFSGIHPGQAIHGAVFQLSQLRELRVHGKPLRKAHAPLADHE